MSTISKNDFVAGVKKSGVIDKVKLNEWLQAVDAETAQDIAAKLIRDQLLTKWQAKYLISGRTRLDIGSYRLLERIQRDELGDRFLALHTSLARKVDLLVLPSTLVKDQTRCDEFMQKASLAATLDHPNLIHVFDIDREGGRLFLVTEHVEGISLDNIGETKLGEKEVARFISQVIAAISHAHENDVIHGCITKSDLLLTNNDEIKIQNLTVSPLRRLQEEANVVSTVSDDYEAISKIGIALLNEIPESNRSTDFDTLAGFFGDVRNSESNSINKVAKAIVGWLETNHGLTEDDGPSDLNLGGFDQPIATTSAPKKKKPVEQEAEQPLEFETKTGAFGRLWNENPVALIATAAVITIMLVGGSAWGAFSLFGDSGTVVAKNGSNGADDSTGSSKNGGRNRGGTNKKNRLNSDSPNKRDDDKKKPNFQDTEAWQKQIDDSVPAVPKNHAPKNDVPKKVYPNTKAYKAPTAKAELKLGPDKKHTVPANTPLKILHQGSEGLVEVEVMVAGKIVKDWVRNDLIIDSAVAVAAPGVPIEGPGNKKPVQGSPMGNAAVPPANPNPPINKPPETLANNPATPVPDALTEIKGIGDTTQNVLYKLGITTYKQLASTSLEDLKKSLKTVDYLRPGQQKHADWIRQAKLLSGQTIPISTAPASDPKAPPKAAPKVVEPFAKFPRKTDLPPVINTKEVKIADLVINNAYMLGAEIISDPGVCKTKGLTFEIRRTPEDKQKWVVGVKRRANEKPTDLAYFRKSEDAFYFQWLPAAEKSKFANFMRNCYLKLNLPNDQATYLTLRQPIKIRDLRLTKDELTNTVEVEIPWLPDPKNIVVEVLDPKIKGVDADVGKIGVKPGFPGKIWLKKNDKNGFLWLQVGADLRSKLKLQSNLVMRALNGQTKNVKNMKELEDLAVFLNQNEMRAKALNQQIQAKTAAPGKKGELDAVKKSYQKNANDAIAMTAKIAEYGEVVPKILNQPLSVRVYVKLGKLTTILAETDPTLFEKK